MAEDGWRGVDEGWGRRAVEFATLSEPANCREYVALHQHLGVSAGDRLLDIACGSGLAIELAAARGASCAGVDAAVRLVRVAQDRAPFADVRVGDMNALPWDDDAFDVVTSFRGIWGTTPDAIREAYRVLRPGGRLGLTVWGHIKRSSGAWALAPFTLATDEKVANQAAMVSLGRPGIGEQFLLDAGFVGVERVEIPFAWEFADPEAYARALLSTGPAYEAIQAVGEQAVFEAAVEGARGRVREGLPLRAEIAVVGLVARKPTAARSDERSGTRSDRSAAGYLTEPEPSAAAQRLFDADVADLGYVMNASRLWAHLPEAQEALFALLGQAVRAGALSIRQRGILVAATASALGDSYCSLAWGKQLAAIAGADLAAGVLHGDDALLDATESALAAWARRATRDPNGTSAFDVQKLRDAGLDDGQIFAVTLFVALRIAFSTVNDVLGVLPDPELQVEAPSEVRAAVTYGRPIGSAV